jgi:hypothetical protein
MYLFGGDFSPVSGLTLRTGVICQIGPVLSFMALATERNQVQLVIRTLLATQLLVVELKVLSGTTALAPPAITAQYLFSQLFVEVRVKSKPGLFWSNLVHEASSVTSCRKACRCSPGRNLKNRDMDCRSTVGSSFPRLAPARKSAQIISRQ